MAPVTGLDFLVAWAGTLTVGGVMLLLGVLVGRALRTRAEHAAHFALSYTAYILWALFVDRPTAFDAVLYKGPYSVTEMVRSLLFLVVLAYAFELRGMFDFKQLNPWRKR